mmetsp:Transcript_2658/g.7421  ORF Transcript_2658/g.7421 Transcript_2658/m.7421 type:complete len:222 (+) Transcript_2658:26-691(+)
MGGVRTSPSSARESLRRCRRGDGLREHSLSCTVLSWRVIQCSKLFCSCGSSTSPAAGSNSASTSSVGLRMTLMKPISADEMSVVPRSHSADTGSPSSRSMSPWWKNSPKMRRAQTTARSLGRAWFTMSAVWRMRHRKVSISEAESDQVDSLCPWLLTAARTSCTSSKCRFISVRRIMWMSSRRTSANCGAGRERKMLMEGSASMWSKTIQMWKFSWMLWSL